MATQQGTALAKYSEDDIKKMVPFVVAATVKQIINLQSQGGQDHKDVKSKTVEQKQHSHRVSSPTRHGYVPKNQSKDEKSKVDSKAEVKKVPAELLLSEASINKLVARFNTVLTGTEGMIDKTKYFQEQAPNVMKFIDLLPKFVNEWIEKANVSTNEVDKKWALTFLTNFMNDNPAELIKKLQDLLPRSFESKQVYVRGSTGANFKQTWSLDDKKTLEIPVVMALQNVIVAVNDCFKLINKAERFSKGLYTVPTLFSEMSLDFYTKLVKEFPTKINGKNTKNQTSLYDEATIAISVWNKDNSKSKAKSETVDNVLPKQETVV